jgi:hypothetical protein
MGEGKNKGATVSSNWEQSMRRLGAVLDELVQILDALPPEGSPEALEVRSALEILVDIKFQADKGATIVEARTIQFGPRSGTDG